MAESPGNFTIGRLRLLAALLVCLHAAVPGAVAGSRGAATKDAGSPDAAQAKAKLAAVRRRIADLTDRLSAELKQRDSLGARLREAELGVTEKRRRLESLDDAEQTAERKRSQLRSEQSRIRAQLQSEHAALAAEVRAEYLLGRSDEMRLLLNQTNPADMGRTLIYYGYFAKQRAARIAEIGAQQARLQDLAAQTDRETEELKSLRDQASREVSDLERAKAERGAALAALREQVQSGHEQLDRLHREEQAVEALVTDLSRVLEDFPVDSHQPFGELRGKLPWPVSGKMTVRYFETRTNGAPTAVRPNGVTIETARGAKVRAPVAGRVVYSDWLQGMGMLLIIAHGGNYLTLYGHAEVLYKSVGDSVAPGDVIAGMSDAAGAAPQLYFEIRQGRKPVDPKDWLRRSP
ncbi:MAG TPA: peptidoglycan DD-metalloendopeptidase family protein [Steroidobacteraceae bacterium]|jgi:septal ring factor EnvC (AmiA/AmiB activator)|nr:peptidoglycan DD-metalloendopeptidase family protein [Steroidobacteraceae bacterium]